MFVGNIDTQTSRSGKFANAFTVTWPAKEYLDNFSHGESPITSVKDCVSVQ